MTFLTTLLTAKNILTAYQFCKKHPKKAIMVIIIAFLLSSGTIDHQSIKQAIEIFNAL